MCPPHLTKEQFGLGRVTVQKDVLQDGAVILVLSKGFFHLPGRSGGTRPCLSSDTCQDP